jgi:hypothetical protein
MTNNTTTTLGSSTGMARRRRAVLVACLGGLVGTFGAGVRSAYAQGKPAKSAISAPAPAAPRNPATAAPAAGKEAAGDAPKVKVERGAGGHKVYRITEEIRIEGKIQKPEAFFFYQKSSISYDWQELKKDFIPRILESVSKAPF